MRYLVGSVRIVWSRARWCLNPSRAILVVADLFHPVHDLAVEIFLNGDMRHRCGWRRATPMLLTRREPDRRDESLQSDRPQSAPTRNRL